MVLGDDIAAICPATSRASLINWWPGTSREIRPARSASAASMVRPVRHRSIAFALPTARVSRCDPPMPGMRPRRISGCPNCAVSEAMCTSHIMASSHPPPKAYPLTAATSGLRTRLRSLHAANQSRSRKSANVLRLISLMSAPAAKAFSEPNSTMAPTSGSSSNAAAAALSSPISCRFSALRAPGRLKVIDATRSTCSTMIVSYVTVISTPNRCFPIPV
jgi:hypothetical protein